MHKLVVEQSVPPAVSAKVIPKGLVNSFIQFELTAAGCDVEKAVGLVVPAV